MKLSPTQLNLFNPTNQNSQKLSTNALSHHNRVQRWANFIAGYSIEFVENCLKEIKPQEGLVIDPFLGCGSTLVASRNLGFKGVGYERHPVFFSLARSKLEVYTSTDIETAQEILLSTKEALSWSSDASKFLQKLFEHDDLIDISHAAYAVDKCTNEKIRFLLIAYFLKVCELSCGSQTDGIYKAPSSRKNKIPFHDAVYKIKHLFLDDVQSEWYRTHWIKQPSQVCIHKSSVNMKDIEDKSAVACITSPPYLNNFDYAEMTRMHLYLLGWAGSWRDISDLVRNNLITNTTTALKGKKQKEFQAMCRNSICESLLQELDSVVATLSEERKNRAGKKEYDFLVYPYYSEITKVLAELYRVLKKGGSVDWIVADAALYGVHLKTHLHTAKIMSSIGFENIKVTYIRKRGHRWSLNKRDGSKDGLGEYHLHAQK